MVEPLNRDHSADELLHPDWASNIMHTIIRNIGIPFPEKSGSTKSKNRRKFGTATQSAYTISTLINKHYSIGKTPNSDKTRTDTGKPGWLLAWINGQSVE
jgi:hypothetical protein